MPDYIVIKDYQAYLWAASKLDGIYRALPQWLSVPYRDYRYGNAQNVCLYSPQMADFLSCEGIRFSLVER